MSPTGKNRRKQLVVDGPLQFRITAPGVAYILLIILGLSLPLLSLMKSTETLQIGRNSEMLVLGLALAGFSILVTAIWVRFTLWRTHKIAGPVVKITGFVHQLAGGNLKARVTLRDGDELVALADALNDMAESLGQRDKSTKRRILGQIRTTQQEIHPTTSPEVIAQMLDQLCVDITNDIASDSTPTTVHPAANDASELALS